MEYPQDLRALKILSNYYYNSERFDKAGNHLLRIIDLEPGDQKTIYAASVCFKKSGELKLAIEIAERLRLREPTNEKYISHLITLYKLESNFNRALKIVEDFLTANPDNAKMLKLKEDLSDKFN